MKKRTEEHERANASNVYRLRIRIEVEHTLGMVMYLFLDELLSIQLNKEVGFVEMNHENTIDSLFFKNQRIVLMLHESLLPTSTHACNHCRI